MIIRPIRLEEKALYNSAVNHPTQIWEWGEFRKKTGKKIDRVGFFKSGQIQNALQVTFHPVPNFPQYTIGYCPRAFMPDENQLSALRQLGEQQKAIFIKIEPNTAVPVENMAELKPLAKFLTENGCQPARPFFAKYTFQVDLSKTEEELFANLESKTRYNVNLAGGKGVKIIEDNSRDGLDTYLSMLEKTLSRQGFYLHSPEYFLKMWETLKDSGMMHIFHAVYDDTAIVSWIIFKWKDVVYYPYGASRSIHREVMASNLMMWEMIMWAKSQRAAVFDMWGCLGPKADKSHSWYGFHRFKKGYGGEHMRFLGTFDLVLQEPHYRLFKLANNFRWKFLRSKTKIKDIF